MEESVGGREEIAEHSVTSLLQFIVTIILGDIFTVRSQTPTALTHHPYVL